MFVEKVGKSMCKFPIFLLKSKFPTVFWLFRTVENIRVRFCETDEPEHDLWEGWGHFTEADVHHQYGIALRTPKYKDGFLEKTVSKI